MKHTREQMRGVGELRECNIRRQWKSPIVSEALYKYQFPVLSILSWRANRKDRDLGTCGVRLSQLAIFDFNGARFVAVLQTCSVLHAKKDRFSSQTLYLGGGVAR